MNLDHMLSNAATASQHRPITDDPAVVGALLRSFAQWLNANDGKDIPALLIDIVKHPQYQS